MITLYKRLYQYHAWANDELFQKMQLIDKAQSDKDFETALRLMGHSYVVAQIFRAHLSGEKHSHQSDNLSELPSVEELRDAVASCDRWYLDFLSDAAPQKLAASTRFTFSDGDQGCMTGEEMLMHVALHGGYHRGEVGRILWQISITPPWDIFSGFLHQKEPARRIGKIAEDAPSPAKTTTS